MTEKTAIASLDSQIIKLHSQGSNEKAVQALFEKKNKAYAHLKELETKHRATMRDVDASKTGRALLEKELEEAATEEEYDKLRLRLRCSDLILMTRKRGTVLKKRGTDSRSHILMNETV